MLVALIDTVKTKGMNVLTDIMPDYAVPEMCDFDKAINTQWPTDKFLLNYEVEGEQSWYRLNKGMLGIVRRAGQSIYSDRIVLDHDLTDHTHMTPDQLDKTMESFLDATDKISGWAQQWEYFYSTRAGIRVIYHLDKQVAVDDLELRVNWIAAQFAEVGFDFDTNAMDWTRCFRLPSVVRDKKRTWESETFVLLHNPDTIIDTESVGRSEKAIPNTFSTLEMPTDPLAHLVETSNGGRSTPTTFTRKAKVRMKGSDHYGVLFNYEPLAVDGGRHMTLSRIIGAAVNRLFRIDGVTPSHIWALIHPQVAQLEPDQETHDWHKVAWRMITEFWSVEQDKANKWETERAEEAERRKSIKDSVLEGMREWCLDPQLDSANQEECWEWISRRLLLLQGRHLYVMKQNGYYDDSPVSKEVVANKLRDLGMDCVIQLRKHSKSGELQDVPSDAIVRNHAIQIAGCQSIGKHTPGGALYGTTLEINTFRRRDIEPEFDERVDEWLFAMFGDRKDDVCEWIAQSLAWDEGPICALSIYGPRGTGKQLLARGLAEATIAREYAPGTCITGGFQQGLLTCPFIVVNEGWPTGSRSFNAADRFRELTAGDPVPVNVKFMPEINVSMPFRVLLMANNRDVVFEIAGNRDLSVEDREALAERMMHVEIGEGGREWIDSRGGRDFTDGWVQGSGRATSDDILAKHFLYLYHFCRTGALRSPRFLVAGNQNQQIIRDMRKRVGSAGLVVEACISAMTLNGIDGIHTTEDHYIVTAQAIRILLKADGYPLAATDITTALKGISKGSDVRIIDTKNNGNPVRWYELDCQLLLEQAEEMGFAYPKKLKKIADI